MPGKNAPLQAGNAARLACDANDFTSHRRWRCLLSQLPPVRIHEVARVRAALQSGAYDDEPVLQATARHVRDDLDLLDRHDLLS